MHVIIVAIGMGLIGSVSLVALFWLGKIKEWEGR
jgi:hypothetical protein